MYTLQYALMPVYVCTTLCRDVHEYAWMQYNVYGVTTDIVRSNKSTLIDKTLFVITQHYF